MRLTAIDVEKLSVSDEMGRSGSAKQFEERLRASIEEIGLAEPIKAAKLPDDSYLVIDGNMRLRAIQAIRRKDAKAFTKVPAYIVDYNQRYEIRFQTDIYQDLLPSQLAALVEHLHQSENIPKVDIARYIGVSPSTLRNYTGLWRLLQREGLFASIVDLMDVEVLPASNPYAWLRLTAAGLRYVIEARFAGGMKAEEWVQENILAARRGEPTRYPLLVVETVTSGLGPQFYREDEDVRAVKRDLGLRRANQDKQMPLFKQDVAASRRNLAHVSRASADPVLRTAAMSLMGYLK